MDLNDVWVVEVKLLDDDGAPSGNSLFYGPFSSKEDAVTWGNGEDATIKAVDDLADGGSPMFPGDFEVALVRQPRLRRAK